MFDHIPHRGFKTVQADDSYRPLRIFFETHRQAIESAAQLLGGRRGTKLARELTDELSCGDAISRRCRRRLDNLFALFSLEHVGDPERAEAVYFARIDPSSPAVEDICLLTDMFRDARDQVALDQPPPSRSWTAA
ncbi:MAG: hypothetical protein R3197_17455 [Paracoccaceae bacterium]|nr:hypothetical protein [Paracoccaceae bacterium]